jgi:hypothetical protein
VVLGSARRRKRQGEKRIGKDGKRRARTQRSRAECRQQDRASGFVPASRRCPLPSLWPGTAPRAPRPTAVWAVFAFACTILAHRPADTALGKEWAEVPGG